MMRRTLCTVACAGLLIAMVSVTAKGDTDEDKQAAQLPAGLQAMAWPFSAQLETARQQLEREQANNGQFLKQLQLSVRLDAAQQELDRGQAENWRLSDQLETARQQIAREQAENGQLSGQLEAARQRIAQAQAENAEASQSRAHLVELFKERQKKECQMREEVRKLEDEAMTRKLESLEELLHQERSERAVYMQQAYREGLAKGRTAHEKEMGAQNEPTRELSDDEKKDKLNKALQSTTWPATDIEGDGEYFDLPLDECLDLWREIYRIDIVLSAEVKTESADILVNCNVSGMTFPEEFKTVLQPAGLTYSIDAGTKIVIQRK